MPRQMPSTAQRSRSSDLAIDPDFLREQRERAAARAARFAREAQQPPPPPPVKWLAHPGGKIVTSDRLDKLQSFIERIGESNVSERAIAARDALLEQRQRANAAETAHQSTTSSQATCAPEQHCDVDQQRSRPAARGAGSLATSPRRRRGFTVTAFAPWALHTSFALKLLARRSRSSLASRSRARPRRRLTLSNNPLQAASQELGSPRRLGDTYNV